MPDDSLDKPMEVPPAGSLGATGSASAPGGSVGATGSASALGEQSGADIRDELADHLELRATELARQGQPPEDAARRAVAEFGNVAHIARQCWWIQQGDWLMKRVLITSAVVLMLVAVAAGFAMPFAAKLMNQQADLANQIKQISESMAALAKAQKTVPQPLAAEPLEIRGKCYLGDPSRPATDVLVDIWRLSDMTKVRRVMTGAQGDFRSQPLIVGDYCVTAPLVGQKNPRVATRQQGESDVSRGPMFHVQSQAVYLYPGAKNASLALNVELAAGSVAFQLPMQVPDSLVDGDKTAPLVLELLVRPLSLRKVSTSPTRASSRFDAPTVGYATGWSDRLRLAEPTRLAGERVRWGSVSSAFARGSDGLLPFGDFGDPFDSDFDEYDSQVLDMPERELPAGKYRAAARLAVAIPTDRSVRRPGGLFEGMAIQATRPEAFEVKKLLSTWTPFEVARDRETQLQVEIPADWQAKLTNSQHCVLSAISNNFVYKLPLAVTVAESKPAVPEKGSAKVSSE